MYCVNIYSATLNSLQRNFSISASFNVLSFAGSDNLLIHTLGNLVAFSYARVGRSVTPLPKDVSNVFGHTRCFHFLSAKWRAFSFNYLIKK